MTAITNHEPIIQNYIIKSIDNPRIYVACLSSYNEGRLYGEWIDLTLGYEYVQEAIRDMLSDSPSPQAEEYAIHDYENIPFKISEWEDIKILCETVEAFSNSFYDKKLIAEVMDYFSFSATEAIEHLEDHYIGEYESLADWAEEDLENSGQLQGLSNDIKYYIDYASYARDQEYNGHILFLNGHVLWND